ncbi:MAG: cell division protein SepF [Defluviitaleaceae bacterium]|nr:cell division protein SepF [Defluviitaleaceae bacterium]
MAFVDKIKNILLGAPDVDDYDDEEFFEEEEETYAPKSRAKAERPALTLMNNQTPSRASGYSSAYTTPYSTARDMVVATISPKNCEEAMLIIDRIKDGNLIIFSLKKQVHQDIEELTVLPGGGEEESKESIFKFICGGIYTLNAEISKFDEGVFIAGPSGCKIDEISVDVKRKLNKTGTGTGTTHAFRKGIF